MLDAGDDWEKVKVRCSATRDRPDLNVRTSEKRILRMMKEIFPSGPRAAMRAHGEFKAWIKGGWEKGGRVSNGVRQWERLWRDWDNYSVDMLLDRNVATANWEPVDGADFSGLGPDRKPEQKPRMKPRMRM
jgi:hypothetical protein